MKSLNKNALYIIISVFVLSMVMTFIDGVIAPPYHIKSLIKVILFLVIPFLYFFIFSEEKTVIKQLFVPRKKDLLISIFLGISVYVIIILGYMLFKDMIDFSSIANSLMGNGVHKDNFIYIAIYISFINSLLEEFFFRGFAFMTLKKHTNRMFAYIYSSVLFSVYHVGMTLGWFHIIIFVLALIGLTIGGCIFNSLNERCNHIYPSWLVHMCANFAINTIGLMMFGMV